MGFIFDRISVVSHCLVERVRRGMPEAVGPIDKEVLFIVDGVGGFQWAPLLIRRVWREQEVPIGTVVYVWQFGLTGEIWTDLMWLRRNRVMSARLARKLLAFRRAHPQTVIHMLGFSGGAGIAVFACEQLRGRPVIDTLILAAPALSPDYNLSHALSATKRCYGLVSRKDRWLLSVGTRLFGTIDRRFVRSAGSVGFRVAPGLPEADLHAYRRYREIRWSKSFKKAGHHGGHTGWVTLPFLRTHLLPMLRGEPRLPAQELQPHLAGV